MRKFGIEIEIIDISESEARKILQFNNLSNWTVKEDHSICGCKNISKCVGGCKTSEIVSPILSDLEEVEKICNIFPKMGARVNKTCGFHVHVDVRDLAFEKIQSVWYRYAKFEEALDLLHPISRREDNNNYCLSIKSTVSYFKNNNISFTNKENLNSLLYQYAIDKYYKLNICSVVDYGSLEFRQHDGTISFEEIKNWVMFCVEFTEASLENVERDFLFRGINNATKTFLEKKLANSR